MFMITRQGKEVQNNDILLYRVVKKNIMVIVNDEEQMKKFSKTGRGEDAPVAVIPYTDEELTNIISSMKQIKSYKVSVDGNIEVNYKDGTSIKFDSSNEEVIKTNLSEQRKQAQKREERAWYDIPKEEKEKKKKIVQIKLNKGLATLLAAATISGAAYGCIKAMDKKQEQNTDEITVPPTTMEVNETIATEPTTIENKEVVVYDFTKEAQDLYRSTIEKNQYILKYQQVSQLNWNEDLALEVVEYINGVYPTAMTYMNNEDAQSEAERIMEAINFITAGNLNTDSKEEDMIDLSQYILNEKERVFAHNALVIARRCIQESIGEPSNGKILPEDEWTDINKFSMEYINSVDQLLNYEIDTISDTAFLTSSEGSKFLIGTIFQSINATLPAWSYVTRDNDQIYYRYFYDDMNEIKYLPEQGKNNVEQYKAYSVVDGKLVDKNAYSYDEMCAMAQIDTDSEERYFETNENTNIRKLGIEVELEKIVNNSREEFIKQANTYTYSK